MMGEAFFLTLTMLFLLSHVFSPLSIESLGPRVRHSRLFSLRQALCDSARPPALCVPGQRCIGQQARLHPGRVGAAGNGPQWCWQW